MNLREPDDQRITPLPANPHYWRYHGQPVLLLGGSVEDNLFQITDLEAHLDLLASVGGNYVRCTMSSRDPGDIWPFDFDPHTDFYDLNTPSEAYWKRLRDLLELAHARDIIVQIEVWDRFDFAREPWQHNPFNPKNNINYTSDESRLAERIDSHPAQRESAFFRSVPELENNTILLEYQHGFVDRLLAESLPFGNVLYCMDNETNEDPRWGWYWIGHIQQKATQVGVRVHTTEMWDAWNLMDAEHGHSIDHPQLATFLDFSQNNHMEGEQHYRNFIAARQRVIDTGVTRPINCVKVYGSHTSTHVSSRTAQENFWRVIFAGAAGARFHRPPTGHGLSPIAQAHLRSMRMFAEALGVFDCEPLTKTCLTSRARNQAFCMGREGRAYGVFFPDGGMVQLRCAQPAVVQWLNIPRSTWGQPTLAQPEDNLLALNCPTDDYWAVLVTCGTG